MSAQTSVEGGASVWPLAAGLEMKQQRGRDEVKCSCTFWLSASQPCSFFPFSRTKPAAGMAWMEAQGSSLSVRDSPSARTDLGRAQSGQNQRASVVARGKPPGQDSADRLFAPVPSLVTFPSRLARLPNVPSSDSLFRAFSRHCSVQPVQSRPPGWPNGPAKDVRRPPTGCCCLPLCTRLRERVGPSPL